MTKNTDKTIYKENIKNLELLGFSNKEACVYITLLSLGEVGASKICKETGLHGQFVYDALNKLEERGFINHSIVRGRKKFIAQNPDRLISFADQTKQKAIETSKFLNQILTLPKNNLFEVYQGTESFITHEINTVKEQINGSEILIIGGIDDAYEKTLGKSLEEYEYQRAKRNVTARYIGSEAQRETIAKRGSNRKLFKIKLLPGVFSGEFNMTIYGDKISFYMFGDPVVIFSLYNKKLAEGYKQFFETLWKIAK